MLTKLTKQKKSALSQKVIILTDSTNLNHFRCLLLSALTTMLVACGGGGGSSSTNTATSSSTSTPSNGSTSQPSPATSQYLLQMSVIGTGVPDDLLRIADADAQFVLAQGRGFMATTPCGNGGQITWVWQNSSNHTAPSIGDTLTGTLTNCSLLTDTYQGTMTLKITQPITAGAGNSAFTASLNLQEADVVNGSTEWLPVVGNYTAQIFSTLSNYNLAIQVDSTGISYFSTSSATGSAERLHDATITRNLDLVGAQYSSSVTGYIASATLNDTLAISTPTPLQSYLDTYPMEGGYQLKTSQHTIDLNSNIYQNNDSATIVYDTQGDGNVNSATKILWTDLVYGFSFIDPLPLDYSSNITALPLIINGSPQSLSLLGVTEVNGIYNPKTQTVSSSSPTFLLQFTRPIDSAIPPFQIIVAPPNGDFSNATIMNGGAALPTANNGAQLQVNVNFVLPTGNYILFPSPSVTLYDKTHQFSLSSGVPIPRTPFTVP